jgi:proline iminopeptidase
MKLFPKIKPYNTFHIQVDKLHKIYVEESGNKKGIPTVCLHGGPGAPMGSGYRRFMNPKKYRIISFHQRGVGKSTPHGSLIRNKTPYLISDMEKIRKKLKINKWIVEGGSWGATLAVLYAIKHPKKVKGLIVFGLGIFSSKNLMECSTKLMAPELYDKWLLKKDEKQTMKFYLKKLKSKKERYKYAKLWSYEDKLFPIMNFPKIVPEKKVKKVVKQNKDDNYTTALLECYYYLNHAFMPDGYIYKNAHRLKGIPGFLLHGRFDIICTPANSYKLHKLWKGSKLMINDLSGHGGYDKNNALSLLKAYKTFEKFKK